MPWFKVDDGFHSHAKAITAGTSALGLWVRCGSWSAHHLTDGFVPTNVAREFGTGAQIKALVASGLWLTVDGGYNFNDFTEYNPTSEAVRAERVAAKERQRKAREAAKAKRDAERSSKEVTDPSRRDKSVTSPEVRSPRPDPTRPEGSKEPLEPAPTVLPAKTPTEIDRAKTITDAYREVQPLSNFLAIRGVVQKAIKADRYTDQQIHDAMQRLAKDGRSVTAETLRIELDGKPRASGHAPYRNPDDQSVYDLPLEATR